MSNVKVEQIESIEEYIDDLSELLIRVVEGDASIGFLPPLQLTVANTYWENLLSPDTLLFVAKINNQIAGSVQLHLCNKQNGNHRAEIAKLMTHPNYRRNGIGRFLMIEAEERAKREGKSLIVLDTREGDPSNLLYSSIGYIQAGKIPYYAKSSDGELHSTVIYYKSI
ncbi:MAG: GNAT family N-acetyltransferase [Anaerobacillus sp.]|uniref:GNAT family N-acetyltransferase n=1 Tax=Anaerobacillus sp. TaxID=1872506 RepID=UPI00391D21FC